MSRLAEKRFYPHIDVDEVVMGGQPVIEGTRIPVSTLVRAHQLGMDFDEILSQYPQLGPEHLHAAFAFYFDHKAQIDAILLEAEVPPEGATIIEA